MVDSFRTPLIFCALLVSTSLSAQQTIPLTLIGRPIIPSDPAHSAAVATPLGALPPALSEAIYDGRRPTFGVQFGYGYVSSGRAEYMGRQLMNPILLNPFPPMAQRSLGVTVGVPALGGAFAATLGVVDPECGTFLDCDAHATYGALWETALVSSVSGEAPAVARFTLGLTAAIGYARTESPRDPPCSFCEYFATSYSNSLLADIGPSYSANLLAISAGLPISVSRTSGSLRMRPFLTPGITYGRRRVAGDLALGGWCPPEALCTMPLYVTRPFEQVESSARLTVGGGLALGLVDSPLTARLGFQQIFADDSKAQLGLALSWQAR